MSIPLNADKSKKKLYTIKERRYRKTQRPPRHLGKTKDVRLILDGFDNAQRTNPLSEMNYFITRAKQREAIEDYHERLKLIEELKDEEQRHGNRDFDEKKIDMGLAMGRKHKHKHHCKRKTHRHKSRRRKHGRHKSRRRKQSRRKSKTRRR